MNDHEFMQIALEEAARSRPEDERARPRVGVVIARDGELLAKAYRNEDGNGSHAEYLALEEIRKEGLNPEGSTVYTTLEPCTRRKNKEKIPCAKRLVDAKVARVVWGIIDPHRTVQSKGILLLRAHQISNESFPGDLAARVEALNQEFIRACTVGEPTPAFIEANHGRSLDEWYQALNRIYWRQNVTRSPADLFGHLVETIAGIILVETGKKGRAGDPRGFVIKAIAWWFALCGRLRVRSVEEMLWAKYPAMCPYCHGNPHVDLCKPAPETLDWRQLRVAGAARARPRSLGAWQRMFREIYPKTAASPLGAIYAHLSEELGELAEAIRAFDIVPGLFLNEASCAFRSS
jgi:pyrimidine deaminase RibD-like protein